MKPPRTFRKATTAGVVTALGTYGGLLADGSTSIPEGLIGVGAGLVAFSATYGIRNEPA